jgi:hypothetical protein
LKIELSTIKVYLISRISEDAHKWNEFVCDHLKSPIEVFAPHEHNPWNIEHTKIQHCVYNTDVKAMKASHIGLALPEFGSDCSYEVGWYSNSHRPVIVFVDHQVNWLRNWMVKGGVDFVVTTNPATHDILKTDPILCSKEVIFIETLHQLGDIIKEVYDNVYAAELSA